MLKRLAVYESLWSLHKSKGKGSWICIAPHCEKLASDALRHGSHSFYAAATPHLPLPRKAFTRRRYHR